MFHPLRKGFAKLAKKYFWSIAESVFVLHTDLSPLIQSKLIFTAQAFQSQWKVDHSVISYPGNLSEELSLIPETYMVEGKNCLWLPRVFVMCFPIHTQTHTHVQTQCLSRNFPNGVQVFSLGGRDPSITLFSVAESWSQRLTSAWRTLYPWTTSHLAIWTFFF